MVPDEFWVRTVAEQLQLLAVRQAERLGFAFALLLLLLLSMRCLLLRLWCASSFDRRGRTCT
jgi:hypothetical protein